MGLLSKFVKFNTAFIGGGTVVTVYNYPELTKNPGQLVRAMERGGRCATTAMTMGKDYYI
jgi:hypothetical protein